MFFDIRIQGFIQALTDLRLPEVKTQSFKPKNKKVTLFILLGESLINFFLLRSGVINGVKSPYKKKNYSPENGTEGVRLTLPPHTFFPSK